jgi:thiosulfate/3-mercaptopyruvate sulfurtransferase
MSENLLISAKELSGLIHDKDALVFDCRFDLFHPSQGHLSWLAAHIPGAVYANLDKNLSGRVTNRSGRHPLPSPRSFAAFLARSGWTPGKRVLAYDAHGGAFASRLWWLMKYFDLGGVSILDGGIGAWMAEGYTMESGEVKPGRQPSPELEPHPELLLTSLQVVKALQKNEIQLVDARSRERFEGQSEPIDSAAGHIPGATNHPTDLNLEHGKFFKTAAEIRSAFRPVTRNVEPSRLVHMCGSGVTACQNQFAMELAGIKDSRVYIGSWSEWIRDPGRPVVQGAR